MRSKVLPVVGVLVAAAQLIGATSVPDLTPVQYTLSSWTENDGLPANTIRAITQDHDGYLWLGTRAGLVRFDGVRFVIWEHVTDALPESDITAVYAAPDRSLWIGFGGSGGVGRLKDGQFDVYRPSDGVRQGWVQAILQDRDGVVWAGGPGGLSRFADNGWEPVDSKYGISDENVLSLYEDRLGNFWVGFFGGAFVRKAGDRIFDRVSPARRIESFGGFSEDGTGALWIADRRGAVASMGSERPLGGAPRSMRGIASRVIHDAQGNLWIAQRGNGVLHVPRGQATSDYRTARRFTVQQGLAGDDVSALLEDREGNIWAATDGGLTRLSPSMVSPLSDLGAVEGGMALTPDGSVWIASEDRIIQFSDGRRTVYAAKGGLPSKRVTALHTDKQGTLWAAAPGGLARLSGRRFSWLPFGTGAPRAIQAMADHPQGGLWLSAANGQRFRWHEGRLSPGPDSPELSGKLTWSLYSDAHGAVWEGFADGSLATYTHDTFRLYTAQDGLAPGSVNVIRKDRNGVVWVGTSTGLSRFKDGRFASLPLRTILPRNMVVSIVEDDAGYLWLGVSSGILRLHPAEFDQALDPSHQVQYTLYGASDGLRGFPYRRVHPTALRGGDGMLRFITSIGVSLIDPRRAEGRRPIGVQIESVAVDERPSPPSLQRLPARTSRIEIAYRALSLTDAENIQFRHMLEGFDSTWVNAGAVRQASYSNLRPGQYRFRVAAVKDGVWSNPGAVWAFTLQPAFYQTTWFYVTSSVGALLLVFGAWQMRQRQIQRQFALVIDERARMAREIHDTLLQSLVGLTLQLDAMATQSESAPGLVKPQLTRLSRQVARYIRETRRSIWDLRSAMLETRDLVSALREAGDNLTAGSDVRLEYRITGMPEQLAPKVDEQLLRIGQEAISNAVRHAHATVVRVELEFGHSAVSLRVADDGRGFDRAGTTQEAEHHLGLTSMEERAFRIGAQFRITTAPGTGTTVETIVPVKRRGDRT